MSGLWLWMLSFAYADMLQTPPLDNKKEADNLSSVVSQLQHLMSVTISKDSVCSTLGTMLFVLTMVVFFALLRGRWGKW